VFGFSSGGFGSWNLASRNPDVFGAMAVLSADSWLDMTHSCVDVSRRVIATAEPAATANATLVAVAAENTRERCSFCGKRRHQLDGLASSGDVLICSDCVKLCDEIVAEQLV